MTDAALIAAFEDCTLRPGEIDHATHVRLAWLYLQREPVHEALAALSNGLRQLTVHLGVPDKYHETVTYAWVFLINERLERTGRDRAWPEFAADCCNCERAACLFSWIARVAC